MGDRVLYFTGDSYHKLSEYFPYNRLCLKKLNLIEIDMKLKNLIVIFLLLFYFPTQIKAAVDIRKKDTTQDINNYKENTPNLTFDKKSNWWNKKKRRKDKIKKRKRKRFFNFFKWKRNKIIKKIDTDTPKKKIVPYAIIGALLTVLGTALLLIFADLTFIYLIGIGGILGWIGLTKIEKNPNELSGKGLAWFSIIITILCIIIPVVFLLTIAFA